MHLLRENSNQNGTDSLAFYPDRFVFFIVKQVDQSYCDDRTNYHLDFHMVSPQVVFTLLILQKITKRKIKSLKSNIC